MKRKLINLYDEWPVRTANKSDMLRADSDAVFNDQRVDAKVFRLRYPHVKTRLQCPVASILRHRHYR